MTDLHIIPGQHVATETEAEVWEVSSEEGNKKTPQLKNKPQNKGNSETKAYEVSVDARRALGRVLTVLVRARASSAAISLSIVINVLLLYEEGQGRRALTISSAPPLF